VTAPALPTSPNGIGSIYGTSRERPFDRWFRYPAGFSTRALELAAAAAAVPVGGRVAEPFLGSAATAWARGLARCSVVGIETHPLIADLASTKLAPAPGPPEGLRKAAASLAAAAEPGDDQAEALLVRRCFEPNVLRVLVGLRVALERPARSPWRRYLRWALLATLRDVAAVKVGWPYQRPDLPREAPFRDPTARFLTRARMMAEDLEDAGPRPDGRVVRGDARTSSAWRRAAAGAPFDGCVTSPPYLNNFDYADATRLELYFLGTVSSWAQMCDVVRSGMVVATTQQSARRASERAERALHRWPSAGPQLSDLTKALQQERANRSRGKEYDQVLPTYFGDLAKVLGHLHKHLRSGAISAWIIGDSAPYGVYVDTPRLIAALAEDLGFEPLDDVEVRSRGLRWRTNGSRHQVPLSERLITFRRP